MPGRASVPSTALPGAFNEKVECNLMFFEQERNILHIIDRCIRYATGTEIPDKTMTSILDAYHLCWMQFDLPRHSTQMGWVPSTTTQLRQSLKQRALS
eukprot:5572328-Pyramimonas_sp.AAC.1